MVGVVVHFFDEFHKVVVVFLGIVVERVRECETIIWVDLPVCFTTNNKVFISLMIATAKVCGASIGIERAESLRCEVVVEAITEALTYVEDLISIYWQALGSASSSVILPFLPICFMVFPSLSFTQ